MAAAGGHHDHVGQGYEPKPPCQGKEEGQNSANGHDADANQDNSLHDFYRSLIEIGINQTITAGGILPYDEQQ